METQNIEIIATVFFAFAVIHTFLCSVFQKLALKYPEGSIGENFFHLLGEVEVVFGLWAGLFSIAALVTSGKETILKYLDGLSFTEPLFVFAIMTIAATRPVISLAREVMLGLGRLFPMPRELSTYFACLFFGPLLGSLITEPAAMTVTALIFRDLYFSDAPSGVSSERSVVSSPLSLRSKYITLAALLVNISIGGVLTHFAAPPVLMVAATWDWGIAHMLSHFGWKSAIAVLINASLATWLVRKDLRGYALPSITSAKSPFWLTGLHLLFLALVVMTAHHPGVFIGIMMFFLGVATITPEYQDQLKVRESLLVAFFLGGLVVFGGLQGWWLDPLIRSLNEGALFIGTAGLTAITDNAALTYLGSKVEGVSESFKYALVAGAVTGGGLTVIANAPNPVAFSVLQEKFGESGIHPFNLLVAAIVPTAIAALAFWYLP